MARRAASPRAQRGVALLGLLAVAVMVFAYVLTSRLNAASKFVGIDRDHNAKVLSQAKQALVGWVAINAAGTDANPGRLPCPQAWGDFGSANEGRAAANCSVPAAGWLPWRTLGLERPLDASGNQIWYVISSGWHLPNAVATLTINSDTLGQLTLDGQAAVALLIAPGSPLAIAPNANQLAAGCAARNQSQVLALPGTPPDPLDFLDCQNGSTADNIFVASVVDNATNVAFNDQVLAVTAADVLPALEAAIADRMQREIAPALRTVYTSTLYSGIPATTPLYPFAAPFANPGPGIATSNFQGASGVYQGLLPFNQTQGCTASASNPRCLPLLVAYSPPTPADAVETLGFGTIESQSCSWETVNEVRVCEGLYKESSGNPADPIRIEMTATFSNVALGLRAEDESRFQIFARDNSGSPPWSPVSPSHTMTMNPGGSVTIRFSATMPNINTMGWGSRAEFKFRLERAVIGDHFLLDTATTGPGAATSWFVRNEWFRVMYYAAAQNNTAGSLPALGCDATNCLRINNPATRNIRALLVLAGGSLSNPPAARPNATLADYFEPQNADLGTLYELRPARRTGLVANPNAPWNDRPILVDWIAPAPTFPLASLP